MDVRDGGLDLLVPGQVRDLGHPDGGNGPRMSTKADLISRCQAKSVIWDIWTADPPLRLGRFKLQRAHSHLCDKFVGEPLRILRTQTFLIAKNLDE